MASTPEARAGDGSPSACNGTLVSVGTRSERREEDHPNYSMATTAGKRSSSSSRGSRGSREFTIDMSSMSTMRAPPLDAELSARKPTASLGM